MTPLLWEYLTGKIGREALPQFHINREDAPNRALERMHGFSGSGSRPADDEVKRNDRHATSQLLHAYYTLDRAFLMLLIISDTSGHIKSALHDIILAEGIHDHSRMRNDILGRSGNLWIPTH